MKNPELITLETKMALFSHYTGCEAIFEHRSKAPIHIKVIPMAISEYSVSKSTLILKELKDLPDTDIILALSMEHDLDAVQGYFKEKFIFNVIRNSHNNPVSVEISKDHTLHLEIFIRHWRFGIGAVDYFRSKEVALPFRGISVEDQVEAGWII